MFLMLCQEPFVNFKYHVVLNGSCRCLCLNSGYGFIGLVLLSIKYRVLVMDGVNIVDRLFTNLFPLCENLVLDLVGIRFGLESFIFVCLYCNLLTVELAYIKSQRSSALLHFSYGQVLYLVD